MIKTPVKFKKDRFETVGGVALTRYLLQIRNHAPCITLHAPRKAEYHVPSLCFEKAGDKNALSSYDYIEGPAQTSLKSVHFCSRIDGRTSSPGLHVVLRALRFSLALRFPFSHNCSFHF